MPPVVGEHEHKAQIRPQAMMSEHGNEARLPLAAVAPAPEPAPLLLPTLDDATLEESLARGVPSIGSTLPFAISDHVLSTGGVPLQLLADEDEELPDAAPAPGAEQGDEESDDLNEVDDAPRANIIHIDSDEDMQPPAALPPSPPQTKHATRSTRRETAAAAPAPAPVEHENEEEDDEDDEEPDDTPYCYCRTKWTGEMMVSCDQCLQWFHADCMGIPDGTDMTGEEFQCDACRAKSGLPPMSFANPRRDRRAELKAQAAAKAEAAAAKSKPRQGSRKRPMSQRQREALESAADAPLRSRDQIENAQKKAKAKAARRAADKAEGLSKQQRAAKRAKERAAREQARATKKAQAEKEAKAGGLKSLIASFDESSEESDTDTSDSDESDSDSSSEDEKPAAPRAGSSTAGAAQPHASSAKSPARFIAPSQKARVTAIGTSTAAKPGAPAASLQSMGWQAIRAKVSCTARHSAPLVAFSRLRDRCCDPTAVGASSMLLLLSVWMNLG